MRNKTMLTDVINEYFKILHESDAEGAAMLFHPDCQLFAPGSDGGIVHIAMADYLDILRKRISPKANGQERYGKIVTLDYAGPDTAYAKVLSAVQPKYFMDYLAFVKKDAQWRIVSKVYREITGAYHLGGTLTS